MSLFCRIEKWMRMEGTDPAAMSRRQRFRRKEGQTNEKSAAQEPRGWGGTNERECGVLRLPGRCGRVWEETREKNFSSQSCCIKKTDGPKKQPGIAGLFKTFYRCRVFTMEGR